MLYLNKIKNYLMVCATLLVMTACMPTFTLEVDITGVDEAVTYNAFPPIVLDYTASSQAATAAGQAAAFAAQVQSLTVTLNAQNITEHVTWGTETATIDGSVAAVIAKLNNGPNVISVEQAGASPVGPINFSMDTQSFLYSNVTSEIVITEVTEAGGVLTVNGYVLDNDALSTLNINGDVATLDGQNFTVNTPEADNYIITAEDVVAETTVKNYVATDAFIQNAVRVRINESLITPQALVDAIGAISGTITVPDAVKPVIDPIINVPLFFGTVQIGLNHTITVGGADFSGVQFIPGDDSSEARVNVDFSLQDFGAGLYVNFAPVIGSPLNLPISINPSTITVGVQVDIGSSASNTLAVELSTTTVAIPNINLNIGGLPTFLQAIINPLIDGVIFPAVMGAITPIISSAVNPILAALLQDIYLGLGLGTGFVDTDFRIQGLSSDTGNLYADVQLAFAAPSGTVASLGAVASTASVAFANPIPDTDTVITVGTSSITLTNLTSPTFAGVDYAIPATVAAPAATAEQNFGIALSSDVINQAISTVLETGVLSGLNVYTHAGQVIIEGLGTQTIPTDFDQLDLRFSLAIPTSPEIKFSGTPTQLNTDVLVPNVKVRTDMFVDGAWVPVLYLDVFAEAGAGLNISSTSSVVGTQTVATMTVGLDVDQDSFKFTLTDRQLGEDTLDYDWGELVDLALLYIKPLIATVLNDIGQVEIALPEGAALSNVTVGANGANQDHLEIGMRLDYFSLLFPPTEP